MKKELLEVERAFKARIRRKNASHTRPGNHYLQGRSEAEPGPCGGALGLGAARIPREGPPSHASRRRGRGLPAGAWPARGGFRARGVPGGGCGAGLPPGVGGVCALSSLTAPVREFQFETRRRVEAAGAEGRRLGLKRDVSSGASKLERGGVRVRRRAGSGVADGVPSGCRREADPGRKPGTTVPGGGGGGRGPFSLPAGTTAPSPRLRPHPGRTGAPPSLNRGSRLHPGRGARPRRSPAGAWLGVAGHGPVGRVGAAGVGEGAAPAPRARQLGPTRATLRLRPCLRGLRAAG